MKKCLLKKWLIEEIIYIYAFSLVWHLPCWKFTAINADTLIKISNAPFQASPCGVQSIHGTGMLWMKGQRGTSLRSLRSLLGTEPTYALDSTIPSLSGFIRFSSRMLPVYSPSDNSQFIRPCLSFTN